MKKNKLITALLAAATLAASISALPMMAEDDLTQSEMNAVVYTYTDENDKTVSLTQGDLDEGHWNKAALGNNAPLVYEDFPVRIKDFVNDFAELKLKFKYLKSLGNDDYAYITVTNLENEETIFKAELSDKQISTDPVEIGAQYKLTLEEKINGDIKEYYKIVTTEYAQAEMPKYITESTETEQAVLVASIDDLRASEYIDENGEPVIDSAFPRYSKLIGSEFRDYAETLTNGVTYRVYTKDEQGIPYTGFFEKNTDIAPEIYVPKAIISSINKNGELMASVQSAEDNITGTKVKNATKIPMEYYRDYSYSFSTSTFKVYSYKLTNSDFFYGINFVLKASDSIGVQVWKASSLTATPTKKYTKVGTTGNINISAMPNLAYDASVGDYLFFVVYFTASTSGRGVISVIPINEYPSSDITNFAYQAYANGGDTELSRTTYTLYNGKDVDVFYVNYTGSTQVNYRAHLYNYIEEDYDEPDETDKCMAISFYTNQTSTFTTTTAPDDIITVEFGDFTSYNFGAHEDMQPFISIYSLDATNDPSDYELRYYQR